MNLILENILLDADNIFLGCTVYSNDDIYVIRDNEDVEYDAGTRFVLSEEDLWYNIDDGHTLTTKKERDICVKCIKTENKNKEIFDRHALYLDGTKTPLHKRKTLKDIEILNVNGDVVSSRDMYYLIQSYLRHERQSLEVL